MHLERRCIARPSLVKLSIADVKCRDKHFELKCSLRLDGLLAWPRRARPQASSDLLYAAPLCQLTSSIEYTLRETLSRRYSVALRAYLEQLDGGIKYLSGLREACYTHAGRHELC